MYIKYINHDRIKNEVYMKDRIKYYQKKLDEAKLLELDKKLDEYIQYKRKSTQ